MLSGEERFAAPGLNSVCESLPAFVFVAQPDGTLIYVNRKGRDLTGRSGEELAGRSWFDLVDPSERAGVTAAWAAAVRTGEGFEAEFRLALGDGSATWFLCRAVLWSSATQDGPWVATCTEIDDRKFAEELLSKNERWYRSTFEHAAVGVARVSPEGRFVAVNDRLCNFFGRTREELLASNFEQVTHPHDLATSIAKLKQLLAGEIDHYTLEKRYLRADGEVVWGYLTVGLERDADGCPDHLVTFVEDISAFKARNDRLERTLAAFEAMCWEWDPVSDVVTYSGEGHKLLGGYVSTGQTFFDAVHPEDRASVRAAAEAIARDGSDYSIEFRLLAADGRERWVKDEASCFDSGGRRFVTGVLRDITERKLAELQEQDTRELCRSAMDATTDCVKVIEPDGTLAYMNPNGLRVMGIPGFSAVRGKAWVSLWPAAQQPLLEGALADALAGRNVRIEAPCPTARGEDKWWDVAIAPMRDAQGVIYRLVAVSRDITSSKKYEQQVAALAGIGDLAPRARSFQYDVGPADPALPVPADEPRELAGPDRALLSREEHLGVAQERARLATAAARIGTWEMDPLTGDIIWDQYTIELFQLPAGVAPTWSLFAGAVHPDDHDRIAAAVEACIASDGPDGFDEEYRIITFRDRIERWVIAKGRAFHDGDKPVRFLGTVEDITDRKRTDERLGLLVDAAGRLLVAHDPAAMIDAVYSLIAAPLRLDAYFHYRLVDDQSLALTSWSGITPASAARAATLELGQAVCGTVASTRRACHVADVQGSGDALHAFIKAEGLTEYACTPLLVGDRLLGTLGFGRRNNEPYDAGEIEFLRTICHYVAVALERVRIEQSLRESERHARELLDQLFVFVGVLTPDGTMVEVNRAPLETSGLTHADVIGKPFWETPWWSYDPVIQGRIKDSIERAARGEQIRYDARARLGDALVTVDFQLAPVRNPQGVVTHLVPSAVIVEDRVQTQSELERLNTELEARVAQRTASLRSAAAALVAEMKRREDAQAQLAQSQKMEALGQLVGGVAHDFNNILAAIQGAFALLQRRVTDEPLRTYVDQGQKAGVRAAGVVRQLLAFARQEPTRPEVLDLVELLPDLEPMICNAAGQLVRCELAVAPDLWPVLLDRTQLEVALLNLAVNARDAMNGIGRLTIMARNLDPEEPRPAALGAGDHVLITVGDTGCGMDEATRARVFEPFFTTKPRGEGTGLGLAQVHGFISGASGAIALDSEPGRGTRFSLYLPRSALVASHAGTAAAVASELHGNATILLVDDDDQVRAITAACLRELGYVVLEAASADAAITLTEMHGFDMLLTDVVMPGTDGPALARSVRRTRPELPVLFFSGHEGGHDLAGETILAKPFTADELGLQVLVALSRVPREAALRLAVRAPDRVGLMQRLSHPDLKAALERWLACLGSRRLPDLAAFATEGLATGSLVLVQTRECAGTMCYRVASIGADLQARPGCPREGDHLAPAHEELLGSMSATYAECTTTLAPTYDWCRYRFEDGPVLFERLVLPFSRDGVTIDHLLGFVLFTDI